MSATNEIAGAPVVVCRDADGSEIMSFRSRGLIWTMLRAVRRKRRRGRVLTAPDPQRARGGLCPDSRRGRRE
jgi:hypothetical protein